MTTPTRVGEQEHDRPGVRVILDDADHPAVENGRYIIGYTEAVNGYRHAFYDERKRKVRYSRTANHPTDPRCPECNPTVDEEADRG